jgi:hypothetical protein
MLDYGERWKQVLLRSCQLNPTAKLEYSGYPFTTKWHFGGDILDAVFATTTTWVKTGCSPTSHTLLYLYICSIRDRAIPGVPGFGTTS